jgi:hypothetical protein
LTLSVAKLRRRFKAICEVTNQRFQNYQIRVHRVLSWLERALEVDSDDQPDRRLLYSWIAFNSLYGTWDESAGFPAKDREAWQGFIGRLLMLAKDELLGKQLSVLRAARARPAREQVPRPAILAGTAGHPQPPRSLSPALSIYIYGEAVAGSPHHGPRSSPCAPRPDRHDAATRFSRLNRMVLQQCSQVLEGLLAPMPYLAIE